MIAGVAAAVLGLLLGHCATHGEVNATIRPFATTVSRAVNLPGATLGATGVNYPETSDS